MSYRFNRMVPSINVLTHACSDVSQPALMINAKDGKKYLVGRISEGFQRSMGEQKIRSSRLQGIWLSGRLEWANVSGLPGYLLTLSDPKMLNAMYSAVPENISKFSATWNYINWHDKLTAGQTNSSTFSDDNLIIQPVLVRDSTCYVVQSQPVRGKFLTERARELGVPAGRSFGQLSNGVAVTLGNGVVVHPHQVLEPGPVPSRAIVLDLPTIEHVDAALETNWQQPLQTKRKRSETDEGEYTLDVIYHFLDAAVDPLHPKLQALINKYPQSTHYIAHPHYSSDEPYCKSLNTLQGELRKALPNNFSVMRSSPPLKFLGPSTNVKILHQGDIYSLSKRERHDEEGVAASVEATRLETLDEPQVITLGTGASCPSKYRNVSSTLVRIPTASGTRALMLDCGEGTVGTLRRLNSHTDLEKVLKELDILYISHMHADHHLGTLELIFTWQKFQPGRVLTVMGPHALAEYLKEWAKIAATPIDFALVNFVDLEVLVQGVGYGPKVDFAQKQQAITNAQLADASVCKAKHCNWAYSGSLSYRLTNGDLFKVAYSGDTKPSNYFARICQGADLLIHEATHDDDLAEEAKAKNHSTVGQAVQVARTMNARHLVLTHFSQRYPKLHKTSAVDFGRPCVFAFDGMRFMLSEMSRVQAAMPQIAQIFKDLEQDGQSVSSPASTQL